MTDYPTPQQEEVLDEALEKAIDDLQESIKKAAKEEERFVEWWRNRHNN